METAVMNKKVYYLESQIKEFENQMNFISNKFCKKVKSEKFKNVYKNYKYSINALMEEPKYFIIIRELYVREDDINEIEFFNTEHYEYIDKYKKFGKKISSIIKFANKSDMITNFEYKLLKDISKRIKNVWKTDEIFANVYENEIIDIPTFKEVEYYFLMLDIIFNKIETFNLDRKNLIEILDNDDYIRVITELKKNLVPSYHNVQNSLEDDDTW